MTTILVIEDATDIRENIQETLSLYDYEVIEAENGLIGARKARESLPDLVLCDVNMPQMDGFQVLEALRQEETTRNIPFVFLTAMGERSSLRRGMEGGADDYITKPFTPPELLAAVEAQVQKRAALQESYEKQLDTLHGAVSYMLPHELRTPLSVILGYTDILRVDGEVLEPSERAEFIDAVYQNSVRLQQLIENFLLYAQIEVQRTNPEQLRRLRSYRLETAKDVIEATAAAKAKSHDRSGDLVLSVQPVDGLVMGEQDLAKIVENLVDNAFKFSSSGQPVQVEGVTEGEQYRLSITDRGHGMTPEQLEAIGAYVQFERKLHEQQGAGMGLSIARSLIEMYGGSLEISSTPDVQTTVRVILNTA